MPRARRFSRWVRGDLVSAQLSRAVGGDSEWTLELLPPAVFVDMPTDPDATHYLRETSSDPSRINVMPPAIRLSWSNDETWREPPIVIDRRLVDGQAGLYLIEGRGRVGMLRGRVLHGMSVAPEHRAWVGRPRGLGQAGRDPEVDWSDSAEYRRRDIWPGAPAPDHVGETSLDQKPASAIVATTDPRPYEDAYAVIFDVPQIPA